MRFAGFEWDDGNREKCQKHGVSVDEIESLFGGQPRVGPDATHSAEEQRFRAVGVTAAGRNLFVIFTWRPKDGDVLLRPVSARYMHKKEVEAYEKQISRLQDGR